MYPGLFFWRCKACGVKQTPKKLKLELFKQHKDAPYVEVLLGNECHFCHALQAIQFSLN